MRLRVAGSENVTRNPYAHRTSFPDVDDGHPGGAKRKPPLAVVPRRIPLVFRGREIEVLRPSLCPRGERHPARRARPDERARLPRRAVRLHLHTATSPPGSVAGLSSVADALSAPPVMNDREPLDAGPAAGFEPGDA